MATSKKLNVINTSGSVPPVFSVWGNQANSAFSQGWTPVESTNDYVRFKQNYNAPFNDVVIPNTNEKGSLQIIGRKGNKMDIVIADKQGNIRHIINQNVSPDFVQNYITNNSSTVAQRNDALKASMLNSVLASK